MIIFFVKKCIIMNCMYLTVEGFLILWKSLNFQDASRTCWYILLLGGGAVGFGIEVTQLGRGERVDPMYLCPWHHRHMFFSL